MADTISFLLDRIIKNSGAVTADAKALKAQLAVAPAPVPVPVPSGVLYPKSLTDRSVRPKPSPLTLGPAGSSWLEPTFGSKMWRVTDPSTNNGSPMRAPSNIGGAWSPDGSKFVTMDGGGSAFFHAFDGAKVTLLPARIHQQAEPWFSYVDPNVIYGNALNPETGSYRLIKKWNLATGVESLAADLDAAYGDKGLAAWGYIGPLVVADNDVLVVVFGGYGQDSHFLVHHGVYGLIDTRTLTVQSTSGPVTGFHLHGIGVDRKGRLLLNPTNADIAAHPGINQIQVYDPATRRLTPLTDAMKGGGHYTLGYGLMVNQDTDTKAQWHKRSLDALAAVTDLITSVPSSSPALSDHTSWRHAQPDKLMPVLSSLFRGFQDPPEPTPWGTWDDEIISISTDGSGIVYRHCHHQSIVDAEYWSQPVAHVNPAGTHAIFTSNWGRNLGTYIDRGDNDKVKPRQDVFLVALA